MATTDLRASLAALAAEEGGEAAVEPGPSYRDGAPVRVRIRKRGRRYDLDDDGAAVLLAGRPPGWFAAAAAVVAADALNVNRRGVVFVPAVEGRDLVTLAARVAATSARLYGELLDLAPDA